jgi:hypothetical protein
MGKVHFLHIGKTGGTALKHALKDKVIDQLVLHEHGVKLADCPPGEKVFFFLRNPVTRFVSGFVSRQRQGRPRYFFPWSPGEVAAYQRFNSANALATALSSADDVLRQQAIAGMRSIQHVRDSFWRWLGTPEYLVSRSMDILFVGQQEHLRADVEVLAKHLSCGPLELPNDDIAAHRNPADADRTLSDEAVNNLTHWYRQEFAAIDLCRAIAKRQGFGGSLNC